MIPLDPLPNLIDQVYARILEAISDRTLQPGQRIRQNELADKLGVSLPAVRRGCSKPPPAPVSSRGNCVMYCQVMRS